MVVPRKKVRKKKARKKARRKAKVSGKYANVTKRDLDRAAKQKTIVTKYPIGFHGLTPMQAIEKIEKKVAQLPDDASFKFQNIRYKGTFLVCTRKETKEEVIARVELVRGLLKKKEQEKERVKAANKKMQEKRRLERKKYNEKCRAAAKERKKKEAEEIRKEKRVLQKVLKGNTDAIELFVSMKERIAELEGRYR